MKCVELTEEMSADNIRDVIQRDCQPWLTQLPRPARQIAWRGMIELDNDSFGRKKARLTGRSPTSTSLQLHNYANELFIANFGKPFRNGIFVVGDREVADFYGDGDAYAIFPIGDCKYLWSPDIKDLFGHISQETTMAAMEMLDEEVPKYRTTGLSNGIRSENEIMIWAEEYYYVSADIIGKIWL